MATIKFVSTSFQRTLDMTSFRLSLVGDLFGYDFYRANATAIEFFDNPSNKTVIAGTGFRFQTNGAGEVVDVIGGTATSITLTALGVKALSVTGLLMSAAGFADKLFAGQSTAAFNTIIAGNDHITGSGLNDQIVGWTGNDTLVGGAGNDVLFGEAGRDVLQGGVGSDAFVFNTALNATTNVDRITDFNATADTIRLDDAIFAAIPRGALSASFFSQGTAARDANDRIVYTKGTGQVFYDRDGNGSAPKVLFAELNDLTALTAADFFIF